MTAALTVSSLSSLGVAYSGYIASRNSEWAAYAESRARLTGYRPGEGMLRHQGFEAGYGAGFINGVLHQTARTSISKVPALCRKTDPETSQKAAAAATRQAGKLRDLVIQHLQVADLTAGEIAARIGVPRDSISPRIAPLKRSGVLHVVAGRGKEAVYRLGNGIAA